MAGRIFSTSIVVFWVTMMAALVRTEFFPKPLPFDRVPVERVFQKFLNAEEPTTLNIYYQQQRAPMGFCRIDVMRTRECESTTPLPASIKAGAYRVHTDVALNLLPLGFPGRVKVAGGVCLNAQHDAGAFKLRAISGDNRLDLAGDPQSRQVTLTYQVGELQETRQFDMDHLTPAAVMDAFGLSATGNNGFLGMLLGPLAGGVKGGPAAHAVTTAYYGHLAEGSFSQRAYLVESKVSDAIWSRIWVDDSGQVLLVQTSLGVTLRSHIIDSLENDGVAITDDRQSP